MADSVTSGTECAKCDKAVQVRMNGRCSAHCSEVTPADSSGQVSQPRPILDGGGLQVNSKPAVSDCNICDTKVLPRKVDSDILGADFDTQWQSDVSFTADRNTQTSAGDHVADVAVSPSFDTDNQGYESEEDNSKQPDSLLEAEVDSQQELMSGSGRKASDLAQGTGPEQTEAPQECDPERKDKSRASDISCEHAGRNHNFAQGLEEKLDTAELHSSGESSADVDLLSSSPPDRLPPVGLLPLVSGSRPIGDNLCHDQTDPGSQTETKLTLARDQARSLDEPNFDETPAEASQTRLPSTRGCTALPCTEDCVKPCPASAVWEDEFNSHAFQNEGEPKEKEESSVSTGMLKTDTSMYDDEAAKRNPSTSLKPADPEIQPDSSYTRSSSAQAPETSKECTLVDLPCGDFCETKQLCSSSSVLQSQESKGDSSFGSAEKVSSEFKDLDEEYMDRLLGKLDSPEPDSWLQEDQGCPDTSECPAQAIDFSHKMRQPVDKTDPVELSFCVLREDNVPDEERCPSTFTASYVASETGESILEDFRHAHIESTIPEADESGPESAGRSDKEQSAVRVDSVSSAGRFSRVVSEQIISEDHKKALDLLELSQDPELPSEKMAVPSPEEKTAFQTDSRSKSLEYVMHVANTPRYQFLARQKEVQNKEQETHSSESQPAMAAKAKLSEDDRNISPPPGMGEGREARPPFLKGTFTVTGMDLPESDHSDGESDMSVSSHGSPPTDGPFAAGGSKLAQRYDTEHHASSGHNSPPAVPECGGEPGFPNTTSGAQSVSGGESETDERSEHCRRDSHSDNQSDEEQRSSGSDAGDDFSFMEHGGCGQEGAGFRSWGPDSDFGSYSDGEGRGDKEQHFFQSDTDNGFSLLDQGGHGQELSGFGSLDLGSGFSSDGVGSSTVDHGPWTGDFTSLNFEREQQHTAPGRTGTNESVMGETLQKMLQGRHEGTGATGNPGVPGTGNSSTLENNSSRYSSPAFTRYRTPHDEKAENSESSSDEEADGDKPYSRQGRSDRHGETDISAQERNIRPKPAPRLKLFSGGAAAAPAKEMHTFAEKGALNSSEQMQTPGDRVTSGSPEQHYASVVQDHAPHQSARQHSLSDLGGEAHAGASGWTHEPAPQGTAPPGSSQGTQQPLMRGGTPSQTGGGPAGRSTHTFAPKQFTCSPSEPDRAGVQRLQLFSGNRSDGGNSPQRHLTSEHDSRQHLTAQAGPSTRQFNRGLQRGEPGSRMDSPTQGGEAKERAMSSPDTRRPDSSARIRTQHGYTSSGERQNPPQQLYPKLPPATNVFDTNPQQKDRNITGRAERSQQHLYLQTKEHVTRDEKLPEQQTEMQRTVEVTGLTEDDEEVCRLYFENEKRSGGGVIEEDGFTWNDERQSFLIKFKDIKAAERVTTREHLLMKKPVSVRLYRPPVSHHHAPYTESRPSSEQAQQTGKEQRTIEVIGLGEEDDELCKLYFENESRSGGGQIKHDTVTWDQQKQCFLVTFVDSKVAERVAAREHKFNKKDIRVKLHTPPPCYNDRMRVSGVPAGTSEDCLQNYLECTADISVTSVELDRRTGEALVMLESKGLDLEHIQQACQESPLDSGSQMKVHGVPMIVTNSVLVGNLNPTTTTDCISVFFQNKKRNAGGPVENVERLGDETAIVHFKNCKDAESVVKKGIHFLDDSQLQVSLHDGQPCPAEGLPRPADGQPHPADRHSHPANRQPHTADGQPCPADRQPHPADGKPHPAHRQLHPVDGQPCPADSSPGTAPWQRSKEEDSDQEPMEVDDLDNTGSYPPFETRRADWDHQTDMCWQRVSKNPQEDYHHGGPAQSNRRNSSSSEPAAGVTSNVSDRRPGQYSSAECLAGGQVAADYWPGKPSGQYREEGAARHRIQLEGEHNMRPQRHQQTHHFQRRPNSGPPSQQYHPSQRSGSGNNRNHPGYAQRVQTHTAHDAHGTDGGGYGNKAGFRDMRDMPAARGGKSWNKCPPAAGKPAAYGVHGKNYQDDSRPFQHYEDNPASQNRGEPQEQTVSGVADRDRQQTSRVKLGFAVIQKIIGDTDCLRRFATFLKKAVNGRFEWEMPDHVVVTSVQDGVQSGWEFEVQKAVGRFVHPIRVELGEGMGHTPPATVTSTAPLATSAGLRTTGNSHQVSDKRPVHPSSPLGGERSQQSRTTQHTAGDRGPEARAKLSMVEDVVPLKPYQAKFLSVPRAMEKLRGSCPGMELVANCDGSLLRIGMPEDSRTKVKTSVLEFLNMHLSENKVRVLMPIHQMYRTEAARERMERLLAERGLVCHWELQEGCVAVIALNDDHQALQRIFSSTFMDRKMTLTEDQASVTRSRAWAAFVENLQQSREGQPGPLVLPDTDSRAIVICDTPLDISRTRNTIMEFLDANKPEERTFSVPMNHLQYLNIFHIPELRAVQDKAKDVGASFTISEQGCVVRGPKDAIAQVFGLIKELVGAIVSEKMTFKTRGTDKYLKGQEGQEFLQTVGQMTKCLVTLSESQTVDSGPVMRTLAQTQVSARCKLFIVQGDITQCQVEAIVNAANNRLAHAGGVAAAIVKAGGEVIQTESRAIVEKHGLVPDGYVVDTSAGSLPCKRVLHAVGPVWKMGLSGEDEMLMKTVLNILALAQNLELSSVAIPAISCGIFGYPVSKATDTILRAIDMFFSKVENQGSLQAVILIDLGAEPLRGFLDAAKKHWKDLDIQAEPTRQARGHRERARSPSGSDSGNHRSQPRGATGGESYSRSHASSGRRPDVPVKIIKGEIAKSRADIIVSTIHPSLDMSKGVLSKSMLEVGGALIQQELQEFAKRHGKARLGKVVRTRGGGLKCQNVFHLSLPPWRDDPGKTMRDAVEECLNEAKKMRAKSIAFPTLGTGKLGYPGDEVASIMYGVFEEWFSKNRDVLKEVLVVVFPKDRDTLQAFESGDRHGGRQHRSGSHTERGGSYGDRGGHRGRDRGGPSSTKVHIGRIAVIVKQGNILTEPCDAIVNSSNDLLDLSKGAVSKSIREACGDDIIVECKKRRSEMEETGLAATRVPQGKLGCGVIIHINADRFKTDWQKGTLAVLKKADQMKLRSVALPALGTSMRGADPEELAFGMKEAITVFAENARSVKEVRIIIFQQQMLNHYVAAFDSDSQPRGAEAAAGEPEQDGRDEKATNIFVISNKRENVDEAKKRIHHHIKNSIMERPIEDSLISSLRPDQQSAILRLQMKYDVDIRLQVRDGKLTVKGFDRQVMEAVYEIKDIMMRANTQRLLAAGTPAIRWQYEAGKDKFYDFDPENNLTIEAAYKKRERSVDIKDNKGRWYRIVFKDMKEYSLADKNAHSVKVRRRDILKEKAEEIPLPSHWAPMKGDKVKLVPVDPSSAEFKRVKDNFGGQANVNKIERVQNPTLFQQFKVKKKELERFNPKGTENEKRLWHGTTKDVIQSIITNGFNRSYCGKNGTALGAGVYFAVSSATSMGYARDRVMFQARVLVGEHTPGNGSMRMAPQKPSGDRPYDSVTDGGNPPGVYVIFHDAQAYPEYLVYF